MFPVDAKHTVIPQKCTPMSSEKICLIGYGYWGKILHKNLLELGYDNITIVDQVLNNYDLFNDSYTSYFIATPFSSHEKLLKHIYSNFKGKKVWCEKPLVGSYRSAVYIYDQFKKSDNRLFVDWTYTFNPCVLELKKILENRKLKQIIINRTNNGPARTDANTIMDLSTHDLSMLYYMFDKTISGEYDFNWNEFSMDPTKKIGSNISWCYRDGTQIIINSSWQHDSKNRISIFIDDNDDIIVFDDIQKTVTVNGKKVRISSKASPLQNAMKHFFHSKAFDENQKLTLQISKTVDSEI